MKEDDKKDKVLAQIYQHLCDCQDLAESIGDWDFMSTFENLRHQTDRKRFG